MVSLKANICVSLPWFPNSTSQGHSRHFENPVQCGTSQQGVWGRPIGYVFMKLAGFKDECSWLRIFARFHLGKSRNCWNIMKIIFCLSIYFEIRKFISRQSESCVLTMSSWSRRVKICGLKLSIEVQLPTVSGNLKKMIYSCLCTSFVSCYCILTEKIGENRSVVTIDHFSSLRVGSLLVSYGDSNVWPGGLLQATVRYSCIACPGSGRMSAHVPWLCVQAVSDHGALG